MFGSIDAYLTAIILFCRTFVQDTYQNLINTVARGIYPVYAYLIQLLFLKLYFTTTYARICLFCAITFAFLVIFMTWYDEALHCPPHKRNKFSLVNQLTLDRHVIKTKLQLPQSFYNVTGVSRLQKICYRLMSTALQVETTV